MVSCEKDDQIVNLESGEEILLFVHEPNNKICIQLISGSAEVFGSELQIDKNYEFCYFSSLSVFTWCGCTLKIQEEGSIISKYKIRGSTQIPKMKYIHDRIEEIRRSADINNTYIPITLVAGPTDVGKSTLCRFLLNYAAKHGRKPTFIDLDVGQSSLSITGTFGVLPVHAPSDVNGKFSEQALSVYYFGYKSPGHNMELYKLLLQKVGRALTNRLNEHYERASGVLIDTCGWVDDGGYKLIKDIIQMLDVNMILVLAKRSLYSKLRNDVSSSTEVIFVDRFKDVVTRNRTVRIDNRNTCVQDYFYGSSGQLQPHTLALNFSDLKIYKADYSKKKKDVVRVLIEPSILYQVFGLSYAEQVQNIPLTSVYGFISIVELDMDLQIVTVLSPVPGPLPTNNLLMGDITLIPKEINT